MSSVDVHRYCTFSLAGLYLGIDVARVQEVLRHQETAPVPLTSPVVGGLMNLRGEIVTTIDLGHRLGIVADPETSERMHVVITTADGPLSLLVDAIDDVITVDDAAFEPAPPTLADQLGDLVWGVFKLPDRLLLVLDADRVASIPADDVLADPVATPS